MGRSGTKIGGRRAALALAALWVAAPPLRADWLVLQDGSRMETKGPWQEKGKLIVFSRLDGTLASLRGSEVNVEASRRATTEAQLPKPAPREEDPSAESPKKKRTVITDKDLPRRAAPPPAPAGGAAPAAASPVTVNNWRKQMLASGEGLLILGTLQNVTSSTASNLTLQVSLTDPKGALLATAPGLFPTRILPPNGSVEFRATFPGIEEFAGVNFEAGGWVPEAPKPDAGASPVAGATAPPPADPNAPPPPPIQ